MRHATLLAIALSLAAPSLSAQTWPFGRTANCSGPISPALFRRVAVYLEVDSTDTVPKETRSGFRVLASYVAGQVDSLLGAPPGELPRGEPRLSWRDAPTSTVRVTAHRDGRLTWRLVPAPRGKMDSLLARAVDGVAASGLVFSWPDGDTGDSTVGTMRLVVLHIRSDLTPQPARLDPGALPVFSLAVPPSGPALPLPGNPGPNYPEDLLQGHLAGMVRLEFVVDTTGRVDTTTVHDVFLPGEQRPTGRRWGDYKELRAAIEQVLPKMRFAPARIDGCPVRQTVMMPFGFNLIYKPEIIEVP
jgi:hypothetical protein